MFDKIYEPAPKPVAPADSRYVKAVLAPRSARIDDPRFLQRPKDIIKLPDLQFISTAQFREHLLTALENLNVGMSRSSGSAEPTMVLHLDCPRADTIPVGRSGKIEIAGHIRDLLKDRDVLRRRIEDKIRAAVSTPYLDKELEDDPYGGFTSEARAVPVSTDPAFNQNQTIAGPATLPVCHPDWVTCFWTGTRGDLERVDDDATDSYVVLHRFPVEGVIGYPEASFSLQFGDPDDVLGRALPLIRSQFHQGRYFQSLIMAETIRADVDLILNSMTHETPRGKWLIVYEAPEWLHRWSSRLTIGNLGTPYLYYNSNLWKDITINKDDSIALSYIRVVLNGVTIFQEQRELRKYGQRESWTGKIKEYRRHAALYRHGSREFSNEFYHPDEIRRNRLYRLAVNDLGQFWSRQYGATWEGGDSTPVGDEPRNWCSEFPAWIIKRVYDYPGFPGGFGTTIKKLAIWFKRHDRWICPSYFRALPGSFSYMQLGNLIRPMYVMGVRDGGHTEIFLNWIQFHDDGSIHANRTSFFRGSDPQFQQVTDAYPQEPYLLSGLYIELIKFIITEGMNFINLSRFNTEDGIAGFSGDAPPGRFDGGALINWARTLNPNSGNLLKVGYVPVINLDLFDKIVEPHQNIFGGTADNVARRYAEPYDLSPANITIHSPTSNMRFHYAIDQEIRVEDKKSWLLWWARSLNYYEDGFGASYLDDGF